MRTLMKVIGRLNRSRARALVILLALGLLTGACGYSGGAEEQSQEVSTAAGETAEAESSEAAAGEGEATELTFWIHGADPFIQAHEEIVAGFEAENPDVTVDLQSFPFADFNTRVTASLPAGDGPDVLEAYSPWMVGYIRTGLMDPVPDSFGSADEIAERYYESPLSLLGFQDQYFGIPSNLAAGSTRVLLVNDDVVQEAGVDVGDNATFEDWVADWQALTVTDDGGAITRAGLGQSCGQPADQFVTYLLQYGGSLFSEDGRTAAFNDEAGRQSLQLLGDLVTKQRVDSPNITDFTCIPQGTAATGYRGTWVIPEYGRDFPDFNYHYELMPLPPGATEEVWQGGSGWATYVPAASENTEAAWRFVEYLEANRRTWVDNTGEIPASREVAEEVAADNPELYDVYFPILEQSVHGYPTGDYFQVYQTLSDMVTAVTLEQSSVEDALATAETAINSHLEQWWSQYPED